MKKKKVPSGSGRDAVPTVSREFADLEWFQMHIIRRTTASNFSFESIQGGDYDETTGSDEDDNSFESDGNSTIDRHSE